MFKSKAIKKIINQFMPGVRRDFLLKNLGHISDQKKQQFWNQLPLFSKIAPERVVLDPFAKILVLAPHPDDDTFGAGGCLLLHRKTKGSRSILYLTHGGKNVDQKNNIADEIKTVNQYVEASYQVLDNTPGYLELNVKNISALREMIETFQPDAVVLPFVLDDHADHVMTNKIFLEALKDSKHTTTVLAYQVYGLVPANAILDVTSVMDEKIRLVNIWKSVNGNRNWAHYIKGLNAFNSRYYPGKEEKYFETFLKLESPDYLKVLRDYFHE